MIACFNCFFIFNAKSMAVQLSHNSHCIRPNGSSQCLILSFRKMRTTPAKSHKNHKNKLNKNHKSRLSGFANSKKFRRCQPIRQMQNHRTQTYTHFVLPFELKSILFSYYICFCILLELSHSLTLTLFRDDFARAALSYCCCRHHRRNRH